MQPHIFQHVPTGMHPERNSTGFSDPGFDRNGTIKFRPELITTLALLSLYIAGCTREGGYVPIEATDYEPLGPEAELRLSAQAIAELTTCSETRYQGVIPEYLRTDAGEWLVRVRSGDLTRNETVAQAIMGCLINKDNPDVYLNPADLQVELRSSSNPLSSAVVMEAEAPEVIAQQKDHEIQNRQTFRDVCMGTLAMFLGLSGVVWIKNKLGGRRKERQDEHDLDEADKIYGVYVRGSAYSRRERMQREVLLPVFLEIVKLKKTNPTAYDHVMNRMHNNRAESLSELIQTAVRMYPTEPGNKRTNR